MTVTSPTREGPYSGTLAGRMMFNIGRWTRGLVRRRRSMPSRCVPWPAFSALALWCVCTIAAVALATWIADPWAAAHQAALPSWVVSIGEMISESGKGGWLLAPVGLMLIMLAALASPSLGRMTHGVLVSVAARLTFVLLAVGIPGLSASVIKRLIGRARPGRVEGTDLSLSPLSWSNDLASFPSGHSTTAFAAAVALGALFPRARPVFFAYAALIALSRVVVTAHYPSDIIAGAVAGSVGALLVRAWFANRRLVFTVSETSAVRLLREPGWNRLKRALRMSAHPSPM